MVVRKKLIEVALPLEAINAASVREKSIRHGHPSTLHLWWARRPLAAARAVLFRPDGGRPLGSTGAVPHRRSPVPGAAAAVPHHRGVGEVGEHHQRDGPGSGAGGDSEELAAYLRGESRPSQGGGAVRPGQAPRLPRPICRGRLHTSGGPAPGSGSPRQRPQPGGGAHQQSHD